MTAKYQMSSITTRIREKITFQASWTTHFKIKLTKGEVQKSYQEPHQLKEVHIIQVTHLIQQKEDALSILLRHLVH